MIGIRLNLGHDRSPDECRRFLALIVAIAFASLPCLAPAAEVTGDYRLLVLPLNYTDDTSEVHTEAWLDSAFFDPGEPESVHSWYAEASYGRLSINGAVRAWQTLPVATAQCAQYTDIQDDTSVQSLVDFLDDSVDFSAWDGLAIVAPECPGTCTACGYIAGPRSFSSNDGQVQLHTVRMKGNDGETVRTFAATTSHELGHSFQLAHAHAADCDTESIGSIGVQCSSERAMGFDAMDLSQIRGHFNGHYKEYLGWFAEGEVVLFDPQAATGNTQVSLVPLASAEAGSRFIKVPVSVYAGVSGNPIPFIGVEYRQAINFDERTSGFFPNAETGVVITLGPEASFPWAQAHLVDAHPNSVPTGTVKEEMGDAALSLGEWFYEPASGIGIGFTAVEQGRAVVTITAPKPDPVFGDGFE